MIIVIVPMIAVALVLFSITADSETGKADAQIAQGLRAAFAIYDADRGDARADLAKVARDRPLARALSQRDAAAAGKRLQALSSRLPEVARIAVYDPAKKPIAAAGDQNAVAPAVAAPAAGGRRLGYVSVSVTSAGAFATETKRVNGLEARVAI